MSSQAQTYDVHAGLEDVQPFTVVGVSTVTTNKDGQAADDINKLWERFFKDSVGQNLSSKVDDVIYAVYSDYEGDHSYPYRITIGYKVNSPENIPDSMHAVSVHAGQYGVMSASGPQPQTLVETWTAIWSSDLNRQFGSDFEVYGPRFFEEGVNEVLIYIGLKK
ncbi:MAG: effector binding domain-containing protein [Alphaproteobacteria bacterium]|nr:effector binding domain-containing protein [Alphaproteobacteria bacterium]